MAFTVNFYNFSKRENSTYRPGGSGASYSCVLKEASSIANPSIIVDMGTGDDPSWNYAYIPQFNRYYYVSDWTWIQNRLWMANLTTDLLATFRDQIGNSDLYVLRSSAASDGSIIDNYYPARTEAQVSVQHLNLPWTSFQNGCVVVGVVSKEAQLGSIAYYALELDSFSDLVSALLDDNILADFSPEDASLALQKALVDPVQYIRSAVYLPITYDTLRGTSASISVWDWDLSVTGKKLAMRSPDLFTELEFNLAKHPLTNTRGNYLNAAPYTKAMFQFLPFNSIDIDTTITAANPNIKIRYFINPFDGMGTLQLFCNDDLLGTQSAQVGVPIQMSQVSKDYISAAVGGASGIGGMVASAITGDIGGIFSSAGSAIGNGIKAMIPHVSSVGSNGSFSHLHYTPSLYQEFYIPVNEDNEHSGRPLCQIRRISSLPGYLLIKDGEVDINGFAGEAEAVRAYLEGGFFYG